MMLEMETRSVIFNLKGFIEDYLYSLTTKDKLNCYLLEERFISFYNSSNDTIKHTINHYLTHNNVVKENKKLYSFFNKATDKFSM